MIQKLLLQTFKETTIISIAHRINTVLNFDKIIVLKRGEIIETGTPKELFLKKGYFYKQAINQNIEI